MLIFECLHNSIFFYIRKFWNCLFPFLSFTVYFQLLDLSQDGNRFLSLIWFPVDFLFKYLLVKICYFLINVYTRGSSSVHAKCRSGYSTTHYHPLMLSFRTVPSPPDLHFRFSPFFSTDKRQDPGHYTQIVLVNLLLVNS